MDFRISCISSRKLKFNSLLNRMNLGTNSKWIPFGLPVFDRFLGKGGFIAVLRPKKTKKIMIFIWKSSVFREKEINARVRKEMKIITNKTTGVFRINAPPLRGAFIWGGGVYSESSGILFVIIFISFLTRYLQFFL